MEYLKQFIEAALVWLRESNINIDGMIAWFKNLNIVGFISGLFSVGTIFAIVILIVLGKATAKIVKYALIIFGISFVIWMANYFFPDIVPNLFNIMNGPIL